MNTQKWLMVAIIVLVVLFIVGIGLGLRGHGDPQTALNWLSTSSLQSFFSQPMDLHELKPDGSSQACLLIDSKEFVIPRQQTCTFQIAVSRIPTRKLRLLLQTPSANVRVILAQPKADAAFTVSEILPQYNPDKPTDLSIFKEDGAVLTLTCVTIAAECHVAIQ